MTVSHGSPGQVPERRGPCEASSLASWWAGPSQGAMDALKCSCSGWQSSLEPLCSFVCSFSDPCSGSDSRHHHRSRTSRGSSPRFLVVTGYPGSQVPATTKTRSLTPRSTPPRNTMEAHIIPYCFLARSYIFTMLTTCFLTAKSLTLGGEFPDEPAKT